MFSLQVLVSVLYVQCVCIGKCLVCSVHTSISCCHLGQKLCREWKSKCPIENNTSVIVLYCMDNCYLDLFK